MRVKTPRPIATKGRSVWTHVNRMDVPFDMSTARPPRLIPVLLLTLVAPLASCLEHPGQQASPPLPDEPGPAPPADAPHAAAIGTTYRRTLVFFNASSDSTLLVLWDLANRVEADAIQRSARAWLARDGEWSLFLDDEWATPPVRGPWRVMVRNPARLFVGMNDAWSELSYAHGVRDLSLRIGAVVSRWSGQRGETYRLLRGTATLAGVEADGLVLDAFTARATDDDGVAELGLLAAGDRLHLLIVGSEPGAPARAWGRLDADRHFWPSVAWAWDETRTFERARRDIPVAWRFHSPWPPMSGAVESVSSHLQTTGSEGGVLPVLGAYEVSGSVTVEGVELPCGASSGTRSGRQAHARPGRSVNEALLRAIVSIVFGALAGGLTNTLAIWMLFHPHRPPAIRGRRLKMLQGAIPKNQDRLARTVGRAVGERLLTREDLMRVLAEPEFRSAFDRGLARFLHEALEVKRPSVSDLLGPELTAKAVPVIEEVLDHLADRIETHVRSDAFAEAVEARAASLREFLAEQPVSDVLTPPRGEEIAKGAQSWVESAAASEDFRDRVAEYVGHAADQLLKPDRTLREMLPDGAVGAMESAIADFMPLAVQRMAGALQDPEARERLEEAVHDVLGRFLQDLRFHQRMVARLVLSGDAVARAIDTIRVEGAERISVLFRERKVEEAMARSIRRAIDDLLDRPVTDVLGARSDPAAADAVDAIAAWLVALVRDPSAHDFVGARVRAAMSRASSRTWGELLEGVPAERVSEWVVAAARSQAVGVACRNAGRQLVATLLERPIGRPARWLPEGGATAIREAVSEPLWLWLQAQVPSVVARMDVARRVEEKVRGFPIDRMERMVRRVTDRELRMIVYLGYALGAIVGTVLVVVNQILG